MDRFLSHFGNDYGWGYIRGIFCGIHRAVAVSSFGFYLGAESDGPSFFDGPLEKMIISFLLASSRVRTSCSFSYRLRGP